MCAAFSRRHLRENRPPRMPRMRHSLTLTLHQSYPAGCLCDPSDVVCMLWVYSALLSLYVPYHINTCPRVQIGGQNARVLDWFFFCSPVRNETGNKINRLQLSTQPRYTVGARRWRRFVVMWSSVRLNLLDIAGVYLGGSDLRLVKCLST